MKPRTLIAAATAAALIATSTAWAQQPAPPSGTPAAGTPDSAQTGEVQPRFIWGILINYAISRLGSLAFDMFASYLTSKLTGGLVSNPGVLTQGIVSNLIGSSGARLMPRSSVAVAARGADIVVGNPDTPLKVDGGKENYQGAHVALMLANPDKTYSVRPVSDGFRTGERFKLRILSTFGGELTIENINPRGERRQIYPAGTDQVVSIEPGKETVIPLGEDQFFEFTRATGREQLVVNLADPRAVGAAASTNKVYRQDQKYGSNFVQEVTPTTFPHISQAIELQHSN